MSIRPGQFYWHRVLGVGRYIHGVDAGKVLYSRAYATHYNVWPDGEALLSVAESEVADRNVVLVRDAEHLAELTRSVA